MRVNKEEIMVEVKLKAGWLAVERIPEIVKNKMEHAEDEIGFVFDDDTKKANEHKEVSRFEVIRSMGGDDYTKGTLLLVENHRFEDIEFFIGESHLKMTIMPVIDIVGEVGIGDE